LVPISHGNKKIINFSGSCLPGRNRFLKITVIYSTIKITGLPVVVLIAARCILGSGVRIIESYWKEHLITDTDDTNN
jgi:hypothetical protein